MPQKQVGWRFDPFLLNEFKDVCRKKGFKPSNCVVKFMEAVVKAKDPSIVLSRIVKGDEGEKRAIEVQARVLLARLRAGEYWFGSHSILVALYNMIPMLEDEGLVREIELELSKKR